MFFLGGWKFNTWILILHLNQAMEEELEGMIDRDQWAAAIEENNGISAPAIASGTGNSTPGSPFPPPVQGSEDPECKQN
jgi:hypothetical protein